MCKTYTWYSYYIPPNISSIVISCVFWCSFFVTLMGPQFLQMIHYSFIRAQNKVQSVVSAVKQVCFHKTLGAHDYLWVRIRVLFGKHVTRKDMSTTYFQPCITNNTFCRILKCWQHFCNKHNLDVKS